MRNNDAPSRVDQLFADGRLIDEALAVAAAEAIERHRQAGEPLVVFRDGRVTRVPAEQLDDQQHPSSPAGDRFLLTEQDLAAPRTANALLSWFDDRLRAINSSPNTKRAALLHEGIFKRFYEELYPLALFVQHLWAEREDVTCTLIPKTSDRGDYDAVICDASASPPSTIYVQLTTTTFNRDESRRMKHFLEHGKVSVFGPVDGEFEFVSHEDLLRRAFDSIGQSARRKSRFSHGRGYVLVISFDDFMWFGTPEDVAALRTFVGERLAEWRLNVDTLYVLGISGRTFLSFP